MNKELNINHPCWGHNCQKYQKVADLQAAALKIYQDYKKEVLSYNWFLLELGLKRSTPNHWRGCRPDNLKILEDIEMYCDATIFNTIKNTPDLVFKYWALTRQETKQETSPTNSEKLFDVDNFGDKGGI